MSETGPQPIAKPAAHRPWFFQVRLERPPTCPGCGRVLNHRTLAVFNNTAVCGPCINEDPSSLLRLSDQLRVEPDVDQAFCHRGFWFWVPVRPQPITRSGEQTGAALILRTPETVANLRGKEADEAGIQELKPSPPAKKKTDAKKKKKTKPTARRKNS